MKLEKDATWRRFSIAGFGDGGGHGQGEKAMQLVLGSLGILLLGSQLPCCEKPRHMERAVYWVIQSTALTAFLESSESRYQTCEKEAFSYSLQAVLSTPDFVSSQLRPQTSGTKTNHVHCALSRLTICRIHACHKVVTAL